MIVLVASVTDDEAGGIAAGHPDEIVVLTPLDLCAAGWAAELGRHDAMFVADGRTHHEADLTGIVTRLALVPEDELLILDPADRPYAACEATAFLAWWLATRRCPVINEPHPTSLVGRRRHPIEWAHLAEGLGIPTHPVLRRPGDRTIGAGDVIWCTVFDGDPIVPQRMVGHEQIMERASQLGEHATQRLVGFAFTSETGELCATTATPPLDHQTWKRVMAALR